MSGVVVKCMDALVTVVCVLHGQASVPSEDRAGLGLAPPPTGTYRSGERTENNAFI